MGRSFASHPNSRRSRLARPAEVSDAVLESAPGREDTAEAAASALDVREAVRTLSPEHRAVLVQIYFRGLSVGETAEVLGCSVGTVKSQTSKALARLRAGLDEEALR